MNFDLLAKEIEFYAVRSRGPGGQNVNKVSSAALLFWSFEKSTSLSLEQKDLIQRKLSHFINKENQIYLRSDRFRDLEQNKKACLEKLKTLLQQAFHKPKTRKATKPTRSSKLKRKEAKTRQSDTKRSRQKIRL